MDLCRWNILVPRTETLRYLHSFTGEKGHIPLFQKQKGIFVIVFM